MSVQQLVGLHMCCARFYWYTYLNATCHCLVMQAEARTPLDFMADTPLGMHMWEKEHMRQFYFV